MRIVHVSSGRLFGGIEQMLLTIAAHETTRGVRSAFAIAAPGRLEESLCIAGADVTLLGDVRLSKPATVVRARRALTALVRRAEADVVVCHAPWSFALFAGVARRHGARAVLWQHEPAGGGSLVERWSRRVPADLVICNSRWTLRTSDRLQRVAPRVVIHPPVVVAPCAPAARSEVRAELGAKAAAFVVLGVSRMERLKGHGNVLRALAALHAMPDWELWVAGGAQRPHEREYVAELQREAAALGIAARVKFLGERRDVNRLLAGADVFCQMNDAPEAFGVAFAEALLARVPVVTADLGGAPEIVCSACGMLVPPGDIGALTRALETLMRDPALRYRLGQAGPGHASARCSPDVVVPQLTRALTVLEREPAA